MKHDPGVGFVVVAQGVGILCFRFFRAETISHDGYTRFGKSREGRRVTSRALLMGVAAIFLLLPRDREKKQVLRPGALYLFWWALWLKIRKEKKEEEPRAARIHFLQQSLMSS